MLYYYIGVIYYLRRLIFVINQISFLFTGVPLLIRSIISYNFIEQNDLSLTLINKYGELDKNIETMVFHQILSMKLFLNSKQKTEESIIPKWLFQERKKLIVRLPY